MNARDTLAFRQKAAGKLVPPGGMYGSTLLYVSLTGEAKPVEHRRFYRSCLQCGELCEPQVTRHYPDGAERHVCSLCVAKRLRLEIKRHLESYFPPLRSARDAEFIDDLANMVERFFESDAGQSGVTVRWP